MSVIMKREKRVLPTYVPGEPNHLPFFIEKKAYQGATGRIYPLPYTDRLSNKAEDAAYDMITLSNEYIEAELLPELGGKIHGAIQKSNGYEFIYRNVCIKPALIGLAGPWVSGGVEFNWPQHHLPDGAQTDKLEAKLYSREGALLVSFRPPHKGRPAPHPRTIPPKPAEVRSIEELYLHGAHLE